MGTLTALLENALLRDSWSEMSLRIVLVLLCRLSAAMGVLVRWYCGVVGVVVAMTEPVRAASMLHCHRGLPLSIQAKRTPASRRRY